MQDNSWADTECSMEQEEERVEENLGFYYFVSINYIDSSPHLPLRLHHSVTMPCLFSLWVCSFSLSLPHSVEMCVSLWVNMCKVVTTKDGQEDHPWIISDDRCWQSLRDLLDIGWGTTEG